MEIEKLIERLQNWDGIKPDREIDCAIEGLKALQAENDWLQAELEKEEAARKKQADILYELRGQRYEQTTAIDQLQAENDRLRRERDAAVELLQGQCEACRYFLECDPEDEPCNSCNHIRFSGGEDHWQWLEAGEVKS